MLDLQRGPSFYPHYLVVGGGTNIVIPVILVWGFVLTLGTFCLRDGVRSLYPLLPVSRMIIHPPASWCMVAACALALPFTWDEARFFQAGYARNRAHFMYLVLRFEALFALGTALFPIARNTSEAVGYTWESCVHLACTVGYAVSIAMKLCWYLFYPETNMVAIFLTWLFGFGFFLFYLGSAVGEYLFLSTGLLLRVYLGKKHSLWNHGTATQKLTAPTRKSPQKNTKKRSLATPDQCLADVPVVVTLWGERAQAYLFQVFVLGCVVVVVICGTAVVYAIEL